MALQALTARTLLVVDVDDPSTAEREVDTALPSACEEETSETLFVGSVVEIPERVHCVTSADFVAWTDMSTESDSEFMCREFTSQSNSVVWRWLLRRTHQI